MVGSGRCFPRVIKFILGCKHPLKGRECSWSVHFGHFLTSTGFPILHFWIYISWFFIKRIFDRVYVKTTFRHLPVTRTVGFSAAIFVVWVSWDLGTSITKKIRFQSLVRASSKMAGRGRGRGRGRGLSFDVGMIGFGRGEALPAAIQQPPPLYPVRESRCNCLKWIEIRF